MAEAIYMTPAESQAAIEQLQAQQAIQSDALYVLATMLDPDTNPKDTDPYTADLKRLVNALNPTKYVFPKPGDAPAPAVREVSAIDVSSHQGKDLSGLIAAYRPEHIICKAYQDVELGGAGADYTIKQAASARAHGLTTGFYIWIYGNMDGARQAANALDTIRAASPTKPAVVFADLETYTDNSSPGPTVIRAAIAELERQGYTPAIYTGNWWIKGYYPGGEAAFSAEYGRLGIWLSQYDGVADLESTVMPAGYPRESLVGKQYSGSPIDRSVMRSDVCGL